MGGLLIKQALIDAHNNPKYTLIRDATTGLAFFVTPHNGGHPFNCSNYCKYMLCSETGQPTQSLAWILLLKVSGFLHGILQVIFPVIQ